MNLQEELEALKALKELKERIAELEEQAKEEQEFPQYGENYSYINTYGGVESDIWEGHVAEKNMIKIGNVFRTEQEAEFAVEKLKVEAELRKFSRPFKEDENNCFIQINSSHHNLVVDTDEGYQTQGAIYFESRDITLQAIQSVGEERIKKYIFGVED